MSDSKQCLKDGTLTITGHETEVGKCHLIGAYT